MQVHPCNPLCSLDFSFPSQLQRFQTRRAPRKLQPHTPIKPQPAISLKPSSPIPPLSRATHAPIDDFIKENELELLGKPSPIPVPDEPPSPPNPELDEALAPFLKLFRERESRNGGSESGESEKSASAAEIEVRPKAGGVLYYEPRPGDSVVGVVVSGNENRLDVSIGADVLGTMLTKEVLPLYEGELSSLLCDSREPASPGKIGVVRDEEALEGGAGPGRPVVENGTVLFAEVLGRTLSGRPLLSTRRLFRRVAWHRVRQIKQLNEPIMVKIFEWNTGGLLTRIEGLRAFLPKVELINKINSFKDLKDNVGRQIFVCISRIDEVANDLIVSEKDAWDILYLKEGTLLEGTVRKIFPFGAQVSIDETNRSGLLHISNVSRAHIASLSDLLKVDEKLKVLVVKSMFPDKISLSIADLESEPGLFLSDKEKVFSKAEEMARRYRRRLPVIPASRKLEPLPTNSLPFDDEARLYANWEWFKFEKHTDANYEEVS